MASTKDALRGFAAPLDPHGRASLYGAPPWHFAGRVITVVLRVDPAWIAAHVPAPLAPIAENILRVSVYDMSCDYGLGETFRVEHPEESCFREGGVSLFVQHGGVTGHYCAYIWCDNDAEIAIGREMYGWPQRYGQFAITPRPHCRAWQPGDRVVGRASRYGREVFDLEVTAERPSDLDLGLPAFENFYTMTALPSPEAGGGVARTVVCTKMEGIRIQDLWSGPAKIRFHAPELQALNEAKVVGGRMHEVAWAKPFGKIVHHEVVR